MKKRENERTRMKKSVKGMKGEEKYPEDMPHSVMEIIYRIRKKKAES